MAEQSDGGSAEAAGFAACLAYVLDVDAGVVPVPAIADPFVVWRAWLAGRGFGLVPIAEPERFSLPGFWIARVGGSSPARHVVMFGVPSGPVFDPANGAHGGELVISGGYAVTRLEFSAQRARTVDSPAGRSRDSRSGRVEALFTAPGAGAPMQARTEIPAGPGGLEGDRYAAGTGTFSHPDQVGGAITLIEAEALEAVRLPDGVRLSAEASRRNVVTRGIELHELVGRRFRVGEVECVGARLCEPCAHLQRLTRPGVLRAFVHRGGLRADVVGHGVLRVGDVVAATEGDPSARKRHALELFSGLPAHYDAMGALLSFGQDPRWRRALVAAIDPRPGQHILDVASGTGMVAFALARRGCRVVGLDQSEEMLARAQARLQRSPGLADRVEFVRGEAEHLPFADGEFDALSFTYLLRYVDDRAATMRELARVVKPGGRIAMVEFGVPRARALRALWRAHTHAVLPLIGRAVSPAWFEVGRFLGPNIEQFHAAEPDLGTLWRAAGIRDVGRADLSFGAGLVMWGVKDGDARA